MAVKPMISKRVFIRGKAVPVSFRMPILLKEALETIAKEKGYTLSNIVLTVLDQYAQQETKVLDTPTRP